MSRRSIQGRRRPDNWDYLAADAQPGDYGWHDWTGHRYLVVLDPDGAVGSLGPGHTVTEHEDGTVSATPSIDDTDRSGWHGWLTNGYWQSV